MLLCSLLCVCLISPYKVRDQNLLFCASVSATFEKHPNLWITAQDPDLQHWYQPKFFFSYLHYFSSHKGFTFKCFVNIKSAITNIFFYFRVKIIISILLQKKPNWLLPGLISEWKHTNAKDFISRHNLCQNELLFV